MRAVLASGLAIIWAIISAIVAILLVFLSDPETCAERRDGSGRSKQAYMTFPREEHIDINRQLDERGEWNTTRVQRECARWRDFPLNARLESDVGPIELIEIRPLEDALRDHPYADSIRKNPKWVAWLEGKPGIFIRFRRAK